MISSDASVVAMPDASETSDAAVFVAEFERFWSAPSADALPNLLTDDVLLLQPLSPATRGLTSAQAAFSQWLRMVPDISASVHGWCSCGPQLFIELEFTGTFVGTRVMWRAVDKIALRGAHACMRASYFDPSPVLRSFLGSPRGWLDLLRSGLWRNLRHVGG